MSQIGAESLVREPPFAPTPLLPGERVCSGVPNDREHALAGIANYGTFRTGTSSHLLSRLYTC